MDKHITQLAQDCLVLHPSGKYQNKQAAMKANLNQATIYQQIQLESVEYKEENDYIIVILEKNYFN